MEENQDIKEAKEELDKISRDDRLRRMALKADLERMDQEQRIYEIKRDAKKKIEEAKRDGKAEGFVVGEKKGKAEGIKKEKQETALKMLQKQMDLKIIKEITGLTEEEIKKLKDKK